MEMEVSSKGKYKLITIYDTISIISELHQLRVKIEEFLELGDIYIAVNFYDAQYLYSGAISVLISCYKMVKDRGGDLCIVEPEKKVLELLIQMNIDSLINIYSSMDELLEKIAEKV